MKDYSYLGVLVDCYIKNERKEQLATTELSPEQSLLDKALEQIVEKINELEKSSEKLIILIQNSKILEE